MAGKLKVNPVTGRLDLQQEEVDTSSLEQNKDHQDISTTPATLNSNVSTVRITGSGARVLNIPFPSASLDGDRILIDFDGNGGSSLTIQYPDDPSPTVVATFDRQHPNKEYIELYLSLIHI